MNPDSITTAQTDSTFQEPAGLLFDTLNAKTSHGPELLYPEGFALFGKNDSIPSICNYQTDSLHSTEAPVGLSGKEMPVSASTDSWVITLMILTFALVAASYKRGEKYLYRIFKAIFKLKERNSLFDDTTINETQLRIALLFLTFVTEGLALYYGLLQPAIKSAESIFPAVLLCITICGTSYLLQRGIYALLGNIFSDNAKTKKFNECFISVNLVIGLFLSPIILLMMFIPEIEYIGLWTSVFLYILARLTIAYKGVRIFSPGAFGLLYIILYLCALEIVPLLWVEKAIPSLYKFVELNFLLH